MARIRSIKPEFPQSESMGRVSREARLLFILLWTQCDNFGRFRENSRMLANLLYPYDDDAVKLLPRWFGELEREGCVFRYEIEGHHFLQVVNWSKHQVVDHPGKPVYPPPREASETFAKAGEIFAKTGEFFAEDQGSRIKDQGTGIKEASPAPLRGSRLTPDWQPTKEEEDFARTLGLDPFLIAPSFRDYWVARPGAGGVKLDWPATWRNWCRRALSDKATQRTNGHGSGSVLPDIPVTRSPEGPPPRPQIRRIQ